jgi:hypothetical protein
MRKRGMNVETKHKLRKVAEKLYERFGVEVLDVTNFTYLAMDIADKSDFVISRLTMDRYQSYLRKIILNIDTERIFESKKEEVVVKVEKPKVVIMEESQKDIDVIIIRYKDGSEKLFREDLKSEIIEEEVIEEPKVWLGLFNYNDDKITIRKGKYTGCDVTSKESISKHFAGMLDFMRYCDWAHREGAKALKGQSSGLAVNPDTPRDMETLNKIIKKLEMKLK